MSEGMVITREVRFGTQQRGKKILKERQSKNGMRPIGQVPRISRLMALAIQMDKMLRKGEAIDYADLARLAQVSRARITQIMNLLHLAPDIQEDVLFLPEVEGGRESNSERRLRTITSLNQWEEQRSGWKLGVES